MRGLIHAARRANPPVMPQKTQPPWTVGALAGALLAAGCGSAAVPIAIVGPPVVHQGIVTEALGSAIVDVGDACSVVIEKTNDPLYNCRVRIRCGEEILYGLPGSGYNRCDESAGRLVAARDGYRTRADGDPSMTLDLVARRVVVTDTAPDFRVTVSIAAR